MPSSIVDPDGPREPEEEVKSEKGESDVNLIPLSEAEMAEKKRRRIDEQVQ